MGTLDRRGQEAEATDNVQRGRGTELPRMRSLVLVASGRQLVAGVEESASFFLSFSFSSFAFSVLSAFLGGHERVAGPVPQV